LFFLFAGSKTPLLGGGFHHDAPWLETCRNYPASRKFRDLQKKNNLKVSFIKLSLPLTPATPTKKNGRKSTIRFPHFSPLRFQGTTPSLDSGASIAFHGFICFTLGRFLWVDFGCLKKKPVRNVARWGRVFLL